MNSQNSQNCKRPLWGIASILFGSAAVIVAATNVATPSVVKAEQIPSRSRNSTITSQMMPSKMMPQHDMMVAGEKTDRHFIEMMISHHEGAMKMSDLALKRSKRPEIRQLAESIKSDQTREIAQMKSWYKQWYGKSVPSAMTMMNHGDMMDMKKPMEMPMTKPMGMQNMMAADLVALEMTPDFDKAFIKAMVSHHKMALMMSSMVIDSDRPEMRTLSTAIAQAQSTEIEQMRQWYKTWYK
ncbi:MAG: DUF305 domain-containing protein [Pseudanabaena sp. CAN_BIN31]|nr:DUF305 domain-containing protein [Pseudanabaena sp. CAN_BIN31]